MATTNNVQTLTIGGVTRQIEDVGARQLISSLQTALNLLTSGDTTTAIESFNEIIAFLENVSDSSTLQGIIAGLNTTIAGKVDKETGKGLSTNDYTDAEQTKLAGIAAGAQVNEINGIQTHDGTPLTPQNGIVTLPEQTEFDPTDYYDKDEVDDAIDEKLTEVTVNAVGNSASMYFAGSALCISTANLIQVTATPTITYVDNEQNVVVSVSGSGTLKAYLDGVEQTLVDGSFTIAKTSVAQSVVVTATAKEDGKAISAEESVTIEVGSYIDTSKYLMGYNVNNNAFDITINGNTYSAIFDGTKTGEYYNWHVDLSSWLTDGESNHSLSNSSSANIFTTNGVNSGSNVRGLQIPEGVTNLGYSSLMSIGDTNSPVVVVVIPSTVTAVGTRAFRSSNISSYLFKSETPPTFQAGASNSCFGATKQNTVNIKVLSATAKTNYEASSSLSSAVSDASKTLSIEIFE